MDLYLDSIGKDFELVEEKKQAIEQIVKSQKGSWYEHREIGLGITDYYNSPVKKVKLLKRIKEQFKLANITAGVKVDFEKNNLKIYINGTS